jgi:predicted RNase H-like HicB family nuclease
MDYKGYEAVVNYDDEAKMFSGEVIKTKDIITFQGESVSEVEKLFTILLMIILSFVNRGGRRQQRYFDRPCYPCTSCNWRLALTKMLTNLNIQWIKNIVENT